MSALFGSTAKGNPPVRLTGITLQTSSQGQPIPIVWGRNRISGNLIWYNDFRSYAQRQSGGKGGGDITSYTYSVAMIMGLCEGPIQNVISVFYNQSSQTLASLNLTPFYGTDVQTPPAFISSMFPTQAESYANTAYIFSSRLDLGSSANLPSLAFEVDGVAANTIGLVPDANPADVIPDYLGNPRYGLGFNASLIRAADLVQYHDYCQAQIIYISPVLTGQEQGTSTLDRWAQITNSWIFWGGTELRIVPLGDGLLINNGATYTPELTVRYYLGYDQLLVEGDEPPLTIDFASPYRSYNRVQLDVSNRSLSYNTYSAIWFDQTFADRFGDQDSQVVSAPEICIPSIAQRVAALIGQRLIGVRRTAKIKLSWRYFLLQPGDIVAVTDPNIGVVDLLCRISEIEEGGDLTLSVTAEELALGIGTLAYDPSAQDVSPSFGPNTRVDQGDTNPPGIFEPDLQTTGNAPEIWVCASGNENWGGCSVYLSIDDLSYQYAGDISAASVQGLLTGALDLATGIDMTGTLSVDTSMSASILPIGATDEGAALGVTSALVGGEVVSWGTIVPGPGAYDYTMTTLYRGLDGTTPASHAIGALFSHLGDPTSIFKFTLDPQFVGVPIYVKLPAFNRTGGPQQSLADVAATVYVPTGVVFTTPPPTNVTLAVQGTTVQEMRVAWTGSTGRGVTQYEVQMSMDGGASFPLDALLGADGRQYILTPAATGTPYQARVRALAYGGSAISDWVLTPIVIPGAPPPASTPLPATTRRRPAEDASLRRRR